MELSPAQHRAARAFLDWSQERLATASRTATKTIARLRTGKRTPYARTLADVRAALEAAGVELTNGDRPGVRMRSAAGDCTIPADQLKASNDG